MESFISMAVMFMDEFAKMRTWWEQSCW